MNVIPPFYGVPRGGCQAIRLACPALAYPGSAVYHHVSRPRRIQSHAIPKLSVRSSHSGYHPAGSAVG